MPSDDEFDPSFRALLQAAIDACDFVYAELQDTPLYDFFILGLQAGVLSVCERVDLSETNSQFDVTKTQQTRLLSMNFLESESSVGVGGGKIFGGTQIFGFSRSQALCLRFKFQCRTKEQQAAFLKFLTPLTDCLAEIGVRSERNWHVFPRNRASKPTRDRDLLLVDMELPVRMRKVAHDAGIERASDFSRVDESSIVALLSGSDTDKAELIEQLRTELKSLGIAMRDGS